MREILESAVSPQGRVKLGSMLADIGRRAKLTDGEFAVFEQVRSKAAGPFAELRVAVIWHCRPRAGAARASRARLKT